MRLHRGPARMTAESMCSRLVKSIEGGPKSELLSLGTVQAACQLSLVKLHHPWSLLTP